ncbi:hypothetical protein [Mesorhizobium amorphae]|uniref:hypothetical protein n=1 Tax=Mesorhizobium amorphae TaxID=71433 RepID=UPI000A634B98|nr:hypothetical protein [Mesorhizobium amorphae]GLR40747.1 hypothetical protein GCM10007880_12630 [Mesorhizobium amorphae]
MGRFLASGNMHRRIVILILAACFYTPAQAGHTFYGMYYKNVKSGINTYIYKNDEIYQDCTISHLKAKVSSYPEHGTLVLSEGAVENTYSKLLPQSKCPRKVSRGIKGYYQSTAGYQGKDKAVFSAIDPAGNTRYTTIYLTVR